MPGSRAVPGAGSGRGHTARGQGTKESEQFRPGCVTYREIFLKGGISFQNRGEMFFFFLNFLKPNYKMSASLSWTSQFVSS